MTFVKEIKKIFRRLKERKRKKKEKYKKKWEMLIQVNLRREGKYNNAVSQKKLFKRTQLTVNKYQWIYRGRLFGKKDRVRAALWFTLNLAWWLAKFE